MSTKQNYRNAFLVRTWCNNDPSREMNREEARFGARHLLARRMPRMRLAAVLLLSICASGSANADRPISLLESVRLALTQNPDIRIREKQVEIGQGALQQAAGEFDTTAGLSIGKYIELSPISQEFRQSLASRGFPVSELSALSTYGSTTALTLTKPLRNGVTLGGSVSSIRTDGTSNDISYSSPNMPAQTLGKVEFSVSVPLLKNSGDAVLAKENAANLEWQAREQDLLFSTSQNVLDVVVGYWNMVAAQEKFNVAAEVEKNARLKLEENKALVAGDQIPAADLSLIRADLMDKTVARLTAEQALVDARQVLGKMIGLPYQKITALVLSDRLPDLEDKVTAVHSPLPGLIDLGLTRRNDRAASLFRLQAAKKLTDAAKNSLKPELNTTFKVGYAGLAEGSPSANITSGLYQGRTGYNRSSLTTFRWSFDNNVARGNLRQQVATEEIKTIDIANVELAISAGIEAAHSNLIRSAEKYRDISETTSLYRGSFENENTKYSLGVSNLINVMSTSDRYVNSRLNEIGYRLNFVIALARLRFETGVLFFADKSGQSIRMNQIIGMPTLDQ